MALSDKRAALMAYILFIVLVFTVPQNLNANDIDIRVEAVGGGLPADTVYAGDVFNIFFRVNMPYTGTISGTLGYSKCQACPSIWQTNYLGIASGVEEATSIGDAQIIYTVGDYVIFLKVIIPGPMGGAAVAGYADFHVIPMTATTAAGSGTDWAVTSVVFSPPNPQVGDPVTFSMVVTALSSQGSFPQHFAAVCMIDGISCGSGSFTYPGPLGTQMTMSTQTPWTATAGTHTLTWGVATIPVGQDPNKSNNAMSKTFTVSQVSISTTTTPEYPNFPIPILASLALAVVIILAKKTGKRSPQRVA